MGLRDLCAKDVTILIQPLRGISLAFKGLTPLKLGMTELFYLKLFHLNGCGKVLYLWNIKIDKIRKLVSIEYVYRRNCIIF